MGWPSLRQTSYRVLWYSGQTSSRRSIVFADRGFNVQDSVGLYCAEVKLPPFTKEKKQLSKLDVDYASQLSRV